MMESWIVVLGWIEFIVALLVLIFIAFVAHTIVKTRHLEFNKYWRSRLLICGSAFVWVIALLLGNDFLWRPNEGLFGSNADYYKYICNIHVFFTVGSAEPLFFVVFLFIIKSKTGQKSKNSLYKGDPNYYVYKWSILCTIPIVVIHIIILILDSSSISEPRQLFWTTYDTERKKCAVPIISTASFAIFFVVFLFFFFIITNRFSKTVLNRNLINRIRLSIGSFVLFLPLEVAIRVVLIFTLKIGNISLGLFHAFFFVDVAVALTAIMEFALFPVLDSIGFRVSIRNFKLTKQSLNKLIKSEYDGADLLRNVDQKDVISVHTNQQDPSSNIMTPLSQSTNNNEIDHNQMLKKKFFDNLAKNGDGIGGDDSIGAGAGAGILTIGDDDDDDDFMSSNKNNKNEHIIEMDKLNSGGGASNNNNNNGGAGTTYRSGPKSPAFDRVLNTNDINRPVSPLSTPLSSSSSTSKTPISVPPLSLNNNNNNNQGYQPPTPGGGHERKKSRRFSLSAKKHKQLKDQQQHSPSSSNASSPTLSSLSTSPTNNQSNVRSIFQPTPVDDFRNQLMKYSKNNRF